MSYGKHDLKRAIDHAQLSSEQAESLQTFLDSISNDATYRLTLPAVLWYFGTALVVLAVVVFSEPLLIRHPHFGLAVISMIGLSCLALLLILARKDELLLLFRSILWVGIVLLTALATIGLQFPGDLGSTLENHLRTNPYLVCIFVIIAAAAGLSSTRFLPLIVPAVLAFLAICGRSALDAGWPGDRWHQLAMGLSLITLLAVWPIDMVAQRNYGFWIHKVAVVLLGVEAELWLTAEGDRYVSDAVQRAIGAALCAVVAIWSVFLRRQSGIFAAMVGLFYYLQHLMTSYLPEDLRPILVGALGIVIVLCGHFVNARNWHCLDRVRPRERVDPVIFDASSEALHPPHPGGGLISAPSLPPPADVTGE